MAAVLKITATVIFYMIVIFIVNRSLLFTDGKNHAKNSEADIFIKQIIGLELIVLILFLSTLYYSG